MLLLLPLPLPLLMLLFSDFCCYQQHTLNVLFSPHLTFQSDWDVLVVVVADAGVAVVLAPLCCVFFFVYRRLQHQLRGRSSWLFECFYFCCCSCCSLDYLILDCVLDRLQLQLANDTHTTAFAGYMYADTLTHNTLIHPRHQRR